MNEELKLFLKSRSKETAQGGYTFLLEGVNFSVIDMPLGVSIQYYYVSERKAVEPMEIMLDRTVSLQEFSQKLVEIIENIKK